MMLTSVQATLDTSEYHLFTDILALKPQTRETFFSLLTSKVSHGRSKDAYVYVWRHSCIELACSILHDAVLRLGLCRVYKAKLHLCAQVLS